MKATRKARKLLTVTFAVAAVAAGSLALATPSLAYWCGGNISCDTANGYLHCVH